jgi:hypothetical protein
LRLEVARIGDMLAISEPLDVDSLLILRMPAIRLGLLPVPEVQFRQWAAAAPLLQSAAAFGVATMIQVMLVGMSVCASVPQESREPFGGRVAPH